METGRAVFDRWIATCDFPVLGANIIDTSTGKPHLAPYKVLERDGVKIVVLGMITPAIPDGFLKICGKACVSTIWKRRHANG